MAEISSLPLHYVSFLICQNVTSCYPELRRLEKLPKLTLINDMKND